ncbi:probable LRR receptor-like serine/threonine-protein kinase At3g47570 [Cucurbita moschata]|uniref:non-specific serine/threonine protein kinase n=1 Tax=Cucurbita moschata TaxID=3662 RepID=A0A6J1HDK9_CUCMO|nr:probable LRR receptor-like serine/threonine-protein kinase At3g47570 [Cucurbita moschata]
MGTQTPAVKLAMFVAALAFTASFSLVGSASLSIETDKQALISIKSGFINLQPSNPVSSWDNSNSSPCNWTRVSCNKDGNRVVALDLSGLQLSGSLDPHIGNLTFLHSLELQNNLLTGPIPHQISNLFRINLLNMSFNALQGGFPSNISAMAALETLDLTSNNILSTLPHELSLLTNLKVLNLARNHLFGEIPPSFGNLSSLVTINFGTNSLTGPIPTELSRLQNLKDLIITINNLTGTVPPAIFNMSSLVTLALASNRLWGTFPRDVGHTLPNLLVFNFCFNEFTGTIPPSLHNITNIQVIRFAYNFLEGTVPPGLENLHNLTMYNIGYNNLTSGNDGINFITSLTKSPHLSFLAIDGNNFEGQIPDSIGNLSKSLSILFMGDNRLSGSIPPTIGNLNGLALLNFSYNSLSGEIPYEIGQLENLQSLVLAKNRFSGWIPSSLGNLQKLNNLDLSGNELIGGIPTSFRNFQKLLAMDLSNNKLNGSIPKEALNLPATTKLNMSNNLLSGPLPEEIGSLSNLFQIDLSNNLISGEIPSSIKGWGSIEELFMARNKLSGHIPSSLGELRAIKVIDLSSNHLSGPIPDNLQYLLALQYLNLSFNDLEGEVPQEGIFKNRANVGLQGNSKLCLYSSCPGSESKHDRVVKVIIFTVAFSTLALSFIIGTLIHFMRKKSKTAPSTEFVKGQHEMVSYDELRLATENFSEQHLIGKGSFGSVYKGILKQDVPVAIKVLDVIRTGSIRSFKAECEALRNVRHRNLVKLITTCSSIDFSNMEFRALIYELLSNGSLDEWVHGQISHERGLGLNVLERVDIAIDVGSAINYLHHDCELPIVHCDLKPSNILLDADMTAKVGDFGLARLLMESANTQSSITSTHVLKGSIGYLPPEYGYGMKPTTAGDVYSFGVTLLELFTGKRPTDEYFTGELNLIKWVDSCFPEHIMEVIDDELTEVSVDLEYEGRTISSEMQKDCLTEVIGVALSCTVNTPVNRIDIHDAVSKLKSAKHSLTRPPK